VSKVSRSSMSFAALATFAAALWHAIAFAQIWPIVDDAALLVGVVPVVVAAWLRGARAGLLASIALIPLNAFLLYGAESDRSQAVISGLGSGALFAGVAFMVGYMRDSARHIQTLTHEDQTTKLPNRISFLGELAKSLGGPAPVTIVLIAVEDIADVNESFGYEVGDGILREVARRIALLGLGVAARIADATFGVITASMAPDRLLAEMQLDVFRAPFISSGALIHLDGSIGIARAVESGDDPSDLVRRAEVALRRAQQIPEGWAAAAAEDTSANRDQANRLETVAALRSAISTGDLLLHFQPVMNIQDETVRCFEALVRWQLPDGRLVPPSAFVPLAEQTGLVVPMTDWVIDEALRQCASWLVSGHDIFVAVNVSAKSFAPSARLLDVIKALLAKHQLAPSHLGIEVTESDAMIDAAHTATVLQSLKELGVRTAVDDFGTGYSSLAYLNRLPLDAVKIDRSFIKNLLADTGTATIVRTAIDLSHALGLEAVAEGVEDEALLQRLGHMGCDRVQGFFIARPMPADRVVPWLEVRGSTRSASPADVATKTGRARILVVDDEHPLRVATHRALTASGFEVVQAATASEALRICSEFEGQLDLVLADIFLTDWRGPDLADHLRQQYPALKVLLMSGDPSAAGVDAKGSILRKPFTRGQLLEQVKEALAA
jgi:diguanylate cyclase (GGDEF)-like protein